MLTTRCTSSRGPHAGCAGRADNVTGMLGVDLGSQSVVGRVNAVTDLSGKDVSARRARCRLVFAAGGSGLLPESHPSPLDTLPPRAARPSSRPRSLCARRRPRCWTSARRCGAREWPCHLCMALSPVLGLPCVLCRHPAAAAEQTCPGPAAGTPSMRSRTWATLRGCAVPAVLMCEKCHASEGMSALSCMPRLLCKAWAAGHL